MPSLNQKKRRSYSFFYKIYRRLRFIWFRKKLRKTEKLEIQQQEEQQQRENINDLREFRLSEKKIRRQKIKFERSEARRLKKELKAEFRERERLAKQEWKVLSGEEQKKRKLAQEEEKKIRKQEVKIKFRDRFTSFLRIVRSLNIKTLRKNYKSFRENAPKRRRYYLVAFNSTVLFLLSYLSLFLISQVVTVIAARFFNYPTIVYYYEIYFNISQEAWFHDSVKTIFSSGPVINFVIGITFLIIYSNIRETTGPFKLFFLWGFVHAVNMLFGALLVGTLFETGVGHVISWMYVMDTGKVLYSILSIFLLVVSGLLATKQFLISGNTYFNEINEFNRTPFVMSQVILPYLAGNAAMLIIRQPKFVFYDSFIMLALIMSILPVVITYSSYNELYFEEEEKKPGISWVGVVALVVLLFVFRGLLSLGLRFSG